MVKFRVFLIGEFEARNIDNAKTILRTELSKSQIKFFVDEGNDRCFSNEDLQVINPDIKELIKFRDKEELDKETILYFLNNKNISK